MKPVYLDYNATTPIDPQIAAAMRPFLEGGLDGQFGNPSSSHIYGQQAQGAVVESRRRVADLLGCDADEIVFTGCGSESDNLALKGIAEAYRAKGNHIITSQIEHPAVINTCRFLERRGYRVTYLPVDGDGRVSPAAVEDALSPQTILVSVMHANNETGVIQPIAEIAGLARRRGVLVHSDAAQSAGKIPALVDKLAVDLLTIAGHKLYVPKGIGALYLREGVKLESLIHGAGHETGRRAGTENVPYIVGLGAGCAIAQREMADYVPAMQKLRDRLEQLLAEGVGGLTLNGHRDERLPNTLNASFPGVDGEALLAATPEVAASTGSACHAGRTEPSGVLTAMGLSRPRALGALRLSLGKFTTDKDVERAAIALVQSWRRLTGEQQR